MTAIPAHNFREMCWPGALPLMSTVTADMGPIAELLAAWAGAIGSPHRRDRAMLEFNPCSSDFFGSCDFFVVIRYRK
jgi:hypothetical protein